MSYSQSSNAIETGNNSVKQNAIPSEANCTAIGQRAIYTKRKISEMDVPSSES